MIPMRTQRCGNCAHATSTESLTRLRCHHEPTPALLANGTWPSVFYDDVCGYWRSRESKESAR